MKQAILRVDDICAATDVNDLLYLYDYCWNHQVPVCFSVIPFSAYRFTTEGSVPTELCDIRHNRELVIFLQKLQQARLVEITLHGWQHHYGELVQGKNIAACIQKGLDLLNDFSSEPVRVLVPPHDFLSSEGLAIAHSKKLTVCSTWAATHGGTRRAHWHGKWRRWRGRPFAPYANGCWPTDIETLDWVTSQRLMRLGSRWRSPVIFVQHYWQLLRRHEQLNQWLLNMTEVANVQFCRFADILSYHPHI